MAPASIIPSTAGDLQRLTNKQTNKQAQLQLVFEGICVVMWGGFRVLSAEKPQAEYILLCGEEMQR